MKIKRILFTLVTLGTLSLSSVSFAQTSEDLNDYQDTLDIFFEKITLDNKVAYRNPNTNEFITEAEYNDLCGSIMEVRFIINEIEKETEDHWSASKINPYRDVKMVTPFQIRFDQDTFSYPVDHDIVITSRFGRRRRGAHRGLDIDLVTGDFVRSVLPGKVRFVGYSKGHGKTVVVRHANDVETVYAHLSAYTVRVNDVIEEGHIVGFGGNTGNSRGSHLHLEVRYKGVCVHPEYVFRFDGSKKIRNTELWVTNSLQSPKFHSSYRRSKLTAHSSKEEAIAAEKAEPRYHRVRKGDTLYEISRRYSVNVKEICSMNSISKNDVLSIGQVIQIR